MTKPVLVIGGGISGITTAIEIAEVGHEVVLVEKLPYLGGKVVKFHEYFPKLCPPIADWRSISKGSGKIPE
ncbi:MAG: FAD-dependent oxidoreductase [Bacteroidota bacterium]|nr:FAD-dependent oxidoreductase [Bacteroidota bacterium]